MTNYDSYVRLIIESENFPANEIANYIGIKPTKVWKKGDERQQGSLIKHKKNGWCLEFRKKESQDIDDIDLLIQKLIDVLLPKSKVILNLHNTKKVDSIILSIVQYVKNDNNPQYYFKREVLESINKIGADIYMDIYQI